MLSEIPPLGLFRAKSLFKARLRPRTSLGHLDCAMHLESNIRFTEVDVDLNLS